MVYDRLEQLQDEVDRYTNRLLIVRQNLLDKVANTVAADMDHADLFSETGSSVFTASAIGSGTTGSGRTARSSRSRRKSEMKKLKLKEGSPLEDLALIHQLHQLYSSLTTLFGTYQISTIPLYSNPFFGFTVDMMQVGRAMS